MKNTPVGDGAQYHEAVSGNRVPPYLRCPLCKSDRPLTWPDVTCSECGANFAMVWDIPVVAVNEEFYQNPIPRSWLAEALGACRAQTLTSSGNLDRLTHAILDRLPGSIPQSDWVDKLLAENRSFPKYLISMKPTDHVLNLGCGWDNTTIGLSRSVGRVTAIDLTREHLQMLALKMRAYGRDNIDLVCGGDGPYLPFADSTFDAVIVSGLLEWVAAGWEAIRGRYGKSNGLSKQINYLKGVYTAHNPDRIQLHFLREVRRVVKDSGEIYIGTDNRHARKYFRGRRETQTNMRFVSLMPRFLAHVTSIAHRGQPYLTYTHGQQGYAKLLARAGFEHVRFYSVEPDYRRPGQIVDLDSAVSVRAHLDRSDFWKRQLPPWLYKSTASCYGVVGSAQSDNTPWLNQMLSELGDQLDKTDADYQFTRIETNRKGKLCLFLESRRRPNDGLMIKAPLTPVGDDNCARNFAGLSRFRETLTGAGLAADAALFPRPVHHGQIGLQKYWVESISPGKPWDAVASTRHDDALLKSLCGLCLRINSATISGFSPEAEVEEYRQRLDLMHNLLGRDPVFETTIARIITRLTEAVNRRPAVAMLRKGDFTVSNIMTRGSHVTAVFDLDEWGFTHLPLTNYADLVFSSARRLQGKSWAETMADVLSGRYSLLPSELRTHTMIADVDGHKIDMDMAAVCAWINHAYCGMQHDVVRLNREWVRHAVSDVFHIVERDLR